MDNKWSQVFYTGGLGRRLKTPRWKKEQFLQKLLKGYILDQEAQIDTHTF